MTQTRKYATLPDLDSAPDIYETTPELTEDNSTVPEDLSQDLDDDVSGVDGRHVEATKARTRFEPSRVDARDVDFSDRLNFQQKSYRTSSRRRRRPGPSEAEFGDFSDEEDEPVDHRLARLRQEIEEVKRQLDEQEQHEGSAEAPKQIDAQNAISLDDIEKVGDMLDSVYVQRKDNISAEAQYTRALQRFGQINGAPPSSTPSESRPAGMALQVQTLDITPDQRAQVLSKAAEFDGRLASIEKALGLDATTMPDMSNSSQRPILPALNNLDRQIATISSNSSLDALNAASMKVHQLSQEADRLKSAAPATGTQTPSSANGTNGLAPPAEASSGEEAAKINALYGTLPTIENLSSSLPLVLERLRTLRLIHASAGDASTALDGLEKRQAEQAAEIEQWRAALQKVEGSMSEGQELLTSNVKLVGEWVKDIELRVGKLG